MKMRQENKRPQMQIVDQMKISQMIQEEILLMKPIMKSMAMVLVMQVIL